MTDAAPHHRPQTLPSGYQEIAWRGGFGANVGPIYQRIDGASYSRAFIVEERHTNGLQNAHGGMLMTFADMAFGHAVSVETSQWWVTVRLTCDFLSPARLGEFVEGAGEVLKQEDMLFTIRGRVWCGPRLLMTGMGIFKAIGPREPRPGEKAFLSSQENPAP